MFSNVKCKARRGVGDIHSLIISCNVVHSVYDKVQCKIMLVIKTTEKCNNDTG